MIHSLINDVWKPSLSDVEIFEPEDNDVTYDGKGVIVRVPDLPKSNSTMNTNRAYQTISTIQKLSDDHVESLPDVRSIIVTLAKDPERTTFSFRGVQKSGFEATLLIHIFGVNDPVSQKENRMAKKATSTRKKKAEPAPASAPTPSRPPEFKSEYHGDEVAFSHENQPPQVGDTVIVDLKSWQGYFPAWLQEINGTSAVVKAGKRKLASHSVGLKSVFKAQKQIPLPEQLPLTTE